MSKKAILTGGTGFIGSNLCRKLVNQNWTISVIVRESSDLSNIEDIKENINIYLYDGSISNLIDFFKNEKADVVFHLASLFIAEHKSNQLDALVDSNLRFALHILEAMKESNTNLIINTSTSWQHFHNNKYNPVNLYAATKKAFEDLLKYYIEAEGIRAITLKLFDTYGETDNRPKLINLLNQFADEQKELKMSPGEQAIDLVHVDDVTNAFLKAHQYLIENEEITNNTYGVGTGKGVSLKKLVQLFEHLTKKNINIEWGSRQYRKREVMKLWRNYETLPNWECQIDLKEGLLRYKTIKKDKI
jgi:nucleoside-diphosphate-sugar epimerase